MDIYPTPCSCPCCLQKTIGSSHHSLLHPEYRPNLSIPVTCNFLTFPPVLLLTSLPGDPGLILSLEHCRYVSGPLHTLCPLLGMLGHHIGSSLVFVLLLWANEGRQGLGVGLWCWDAKETSCHLGDYGQRPRAQLLEREPASSCEPFSESPSLLGW